MQTTSWPKSNWLNNILSQKDNLLADPKLTNAQQPLNKNPNKNSIKKEKVSNQVGDIAFTNEGMQPLVDPSDSLKDFLYWVNKDLSQTVHTLVNGQKILLQNFKSEHNENLIEILDKFQQETSHKLSNNIIFIDQLFVKQEFKPVDEKLFEPPKNTQVTIGAQKKIQKQKQRLFYGNKYTKAKQKLAEQLKQEQASSTSEESQIAFQQAKKVQAKISVVPKGKPKGRKPKPKVQNQLENKIIIQRPQTEQHQEVQNLQEKNAQEIQVEKKEQEQQQQQEQEQFNNKEQQQEQQIEQKVTEPTQVQDQSPQKQDC